MSRVKIDKTIYSVTVVSDLGEREVKGTIKDLIIYFSNTLVNGCIKNKKINLNPKNISSLVYNVNLGYREQKDYKKIKEFND